MTAIRQHLLEQREQNKVLWIDGSNVILISQFAYEGVASGILYIRNEPHLIPEEVDDPRIDEDTDTLGHVGYLVTNDEDSVGFDCLVRGPNTWQQIQADSPVFL